MASDVLSLPRRQGDAARRARGPNRRRVPVPRRDAAVRADPDRGPRGAPARRTRRRTRDHLACDGRVVSVQVARDLAGVDWLAVTSDLVADNCDNGRIPAALHRSFAQSQHVAIAWDDDLVV